MALNDAVEEWLLLRSPANRLIVPLDLERREVRIDEGLVATSRGHDRTEAKNARSRRTIPIDATTARTFAHEHTDRVRCAWPTTPSRSVSGSARRGRA